MNVESRIPRTIADMVGRIVTGIRQSHDELAFVCSDGYVFRFYHCQDCCEDVKIEDVCGDLDDLIGHPITLADERIDDRGFEDCESHTFTFYEYATNKGSVTVRWHGASNGYYSESVDLDVIAPDGTYVR